MFKFIIKVALIYLIATSGSLANTLTKDTLLSNNQVICTVKQCTELLGAYITSLAKPDIWSEHVKEDYSIKKAPWEDPYRSDIKLYYIDKQVYQIELKLTGDSLGKQYVGSRLLWMINTSYDFVHIFIEEKYKNDFQQQITNYIVKWAKNIDKMQSEQYQYGDILLTLQATAANDQNNIILLLTFKNTSPSLPSVEQLSKESLVKYQAYQFPDTPYFNYGIDLGYSDAIANLTTKEKKALIEQEAKRLQQEYKNVEVLNQLIADLQSVLPNGRKGLAEEIKKIEIIQDKYQQQMTELNETAKEMLVSPEEFLYLLKPPTIPSSPKAPPPEKPVIYLYPGHKMDVKVQLDYKGEFLVTFPSYLEDGWRVTAYPDGKLIDHFDHKEYSYLFWEGKPNAAQYDMTKGFVVKGSDTAKFLQEKLAYLGLTPKEYNEFIVYWLPRMQQSPYNLITFQGKEYEEIAPLIITPKPDSILRVFMVYKALLEPIDIPKPELKRFERQGFSVIEWGGAELTE